MWLEKTMTQSWFADDPPFLVVTIFLARLVQSYKNQARASSGIPPAVMVQSNFVEDVYHDGERLLQQNVILNSDIVADIAASPDFVSKYIGVEKINIGAGYTIRLENEEKDIYKNPVNCEQHIRPEGVISDISQAPGGFTTTHIGETISKNYGVYMSLGRSFQFYKRDS
jgi:hypothetical protein